MSWRICRAGQGTSSLDEPSPRRHHSSAAGVLVDLHRNRPCLALKYGAYYVTGSVALYSDALESIVNVVAAMAAWWAIRVSYKPADQNHPFGHHKAEYFSAVLEGVLIVVAALLILREVWRRLGDTQDTGTALAWSCDQRRGIGHQSRSGHRCSSTAGANTDPRHLQADGKHIMTDVVTSVGVFAGLVGAILTGWTHPRSAACRHRGAEYPLAGLERDRQFGARPDGSRPWRPGRAHAHPRRHFRQCRRRAGSA